MVAALQLSGSERVLEVGTGLGFQTAILAMLARQVVSVERFADLAEQARANLAAVGLGRVTVVVGDGTLGVPEHAPYHAMVSRPPPPTSLRRSSSSSPQGDGWCIRSARAAASWSPRSRRRGTG